MDDTHDPAAVSWVASANTPDTDFPIQNLPFGRFTVPGGGARVGVAVGDAVVPLAAVHESAASVNELMVRPRAHQRDLRRSLFKALRADAPPAVQRQIREAMVPLREVVLDVPWDVGEFTDFFASIHHAMNASALMHPGAPLFPSYRHMPLAYHARRSSIVVSGTEIRRPYGQQRRRDRGPVYEPTRRLDYEAEIGWIIGAGNLRGEPIPVERAWDHLFGVCLINDWSARDVQAWEAEPLGPFLAKNFATTVSPWIVTVDALEPFRVGAVARGAADPPLLEYLVSRSDPRSGAIAAELDVEVQTAAMREASDPPARLARLATAGQYWSVAQLIAQHTANGCNLRPGDLLGSGTLSGPSREALGCLLELTRGGREPITLPNGEARSFLEDGDEIVFRARAVVPGARTIGFGECRGRITSAAESTST